MISELEGEGNGNPLQYSCLENPMDGGALVGCHLWGRTEITPERTKRQSQRKNTVDVMGDGSKV